MGDIADEHDEKIDNHYKIDENTFVFDGMMDLESIEEICGIAFEESFDQITLGGYVFSLLGRQPAIGDIIADKNCEFEISEVDGIRIKKLKLKLLPAPTEEA